MADYDEIHHHILGMADALSTGVIPPPIQLTRTRWPGQPNSNSPDHAKATSRLDRHHAHEPHH